LREQLASALGLSPAAVADALGALARHGFVIETHPMQGVRLSAVPPALLAAELAWDAARRRVGRIVRCEATVASTNDLAWEAARKTGQDSDGLAIFAEYQTAGRGRRGNRWLAPPHEAILCSVVLRAADAAADGAVLTRAAALAAAEAIEDQTGLEVGIKWPNDVVCDDRKVGGILVEARPGAPGAGFVVVGIGINCHQGPRAFPPDIRGHVTSLAMLGPTVDRTLLARSLLDRLDRRAAQTAREDGAGEVRQDAARRCRTLGRRITVLEGEDAYSGEVIDLDVDYGLILRLSDGGFRRFHAMTTRVAAPKDESGG
jgi:BirA family biotin operon repressor/biotin-[acetyl-CoA-carboxylase] ligase